MEASNVERATLLIAIATASGAFMIGFNLGAFDVVFFDALLSIWVIATLVFVASFATDVAPQSWAARLVLLLPTLWLVLAWISGPASNDATSNALFVVTLIVTLVTLPFLGWLIVSTINPSFLELPRPNVIAVIAALIVFALVGFGLGARNDLILNCDDFKVSGNDLPDNCTSGPNTVNPNQ